MFRGRFQLAVHALGMIALILAVVGCSSDAPTMPGPDLTGGSAGASPSRASHHQLWGEYLITLRDVEDASGNMVTVEADVQPLRSGEVHVNVTVFTKPPYCGGKGCVKIAVAEFIPGDPIQTVVVTVQLTNPALQVTGYDVRGIIYPEPGKAGLENLDGLTTLWAQPGDLPANPYKAFNKETLFRPFAGGAIHGTSYRLWKHKDYKAVNMVYRIDASWPTNAAEPVGCYVPPIDGPIHPQGSNAMILAVITDWQNDVAGVTITLDEAFGITDPQPMTMVSQDPSNCTSTWQYLLTAGGGHPAGNRTMRITAQDSVDPLLYMYDFTVAVVYDNVGPVWKDPDEEGIYDHISGGNYLWLFFHEGWDVSVPFQYIFHGSAAQEPFSVANTLKVILSDSYEGYTTFGQAGGAPDNQLRWFGIDMKDAQGNNDGYPDEMTYSCTRYSINARWSLLKGQPPGSFGIFSGPAIGDVNGDGQKDIVVGARDRKVYAFGGAGTGTQDTTIWQFQTGGEVKCSPALVDLNGDQALDVVFGSDDMNVYAVNGSTGLSIWQVDVSDGGSFLMQASPSIAQLNEGAYDVVIGTGQGDMLALNGEDGSEIWTYPATNGIAGTCAVADVTGDDVPDVCFGAYDQTVYMVNGETGGEVWKYYAGPGLCNIECPPVLVDINQDSVPDCIVGARNGVGPTAGAIYALDGTDGGEIWIQGEIWGTPKRGPAPVHINDDGIYDFLVCSTQMELHSFYAIDGATGAIIYAQPPVPDIDPLTPFDYSAPIIGDFTGDGHINAFYGRQDGFCDLVNVADLDLPGVEEWRILFSPQVSSVGGYDDISGTPAVADVDKDGELELIACNLRGYVFVLDLHAPVPTDPALREWTQHSGNRWHTGTPGFIPPDVPED